MEQKNNAYAEALFLIAQEENRTEEYLEALKDICAVFRETPEYPLFLSSYTVSKEERVNAVEQAFGRALPEKAVSFLCILCERRRANEIFEIETEFEKMYFKKENISRACVTSAYPLNEEQAKRLEERLTKLCAHRIVTEFKTDGSLLGGIKVEVDGKIIDSSVRNQLNKLREVMDK